jgi:hypothetical protein
VQFYEVQVSANADFLPGFTFFNTAHNVFTTSQANASTSQEGIHYWRVRVLDGANNFSPWSAVRRFTVGAPVWTNFAAVALTPEAVVGGGTIVGRLHIQNVAPAGGQVYTLESSNSSVASVAPSVTVPAGASSATFTVTTHPVSVSTPVQLRVWSEGNGDHPVLWVDPGDGGAPSVSLTSLALNPTTVTGGGSSTGTITLSGAAPAGGFAVSLSDTSAAVTTPSSVTVAAGATSASFTATTTTVTSTTLVTVTASAAGISRTADLTVTAAGGGGTSLFLNPASNQPDTTSGDRNGFQTAPQNAHAEDGLVATDTNSGSSTSTSCTNSGKDRHRFFDFGFGIADGSAIAGIELRLRARADSTSGAPRMCVQLSWDGGATWTAAKATSTLATTLNTLTLGGPADTWGRSWTAAQLSNASFRLRVINVSSSTSRDFFLDSVGVRVHSGTPAPAALQSVGVNPATVTGGSSSSGSVSLTTAAPSGGATVSLSSSNTSAATVPATVTVASGATLATFPVSTSPVTASTSVIITGVYGGVTRTATLSVNPQPSAATLTVTATGRSGERVISSPAGISVSVGSTGSASFALGTSITLSVSNGRDAVWSGACSSGGNKTRTCTFTLNGNASITANVQ